MNIKRSLSYIIYVTIAVSFMTCNIQHETSLFNGETFQGWEGDTVNTWRIENGAIVGGSLSEKVPHNDFICTMKTYDNFVLRLKFKLEGSEGFINAGVQFRSKRVSNPNYEMTGYQADIGEGINGALYDETRRDKYLVAIDSTISNAYTKVGDWNDMEIRAVGDNIMIFLNGHPTVDYTEPDSDIPQKGVLGLQVHGGGKVLVKYKEISIEEL